MNKYLKAVVILALLGISALSNATPPTRGTYIAHLYNDDDTKLLPHQTWEICIESDGYWYMDSNKDPLIWFGKWFNKGNDTHFQAIAKPNSTMSFNISQINKKLFTGHYLAVMQHIGQSMTMTLTYKSPSCFYDDPLFEWGLTEYSIQ